MALEATTLHDYCLALMIGASPIVFVLLRFVVAPYGKHGAAGWGPTVDAKLGWMAMESPASIVFCATLVMLAPQPLTALPAPILVLVALWLLHYIHRAFIFPFQIQTQNRMPVMVCLSALLFCTINGFMQAAFLVDTVRAAHLYDAAYVRDPRFIVGVVLFATGYWLNKRCDRILHDLRKTPAVKGEPVAPRGYRIPHGSVFEYVSAANYFAETVEWCGFAVSAWSPAGGAFVAFTIANLLPRALDTHAWYVKTFGDAYPAQRRAMIPFVI